MFNNLTRLQEEAVNGKALRTRQTLTMNHALSMGLVCRKEYGLRVRAAQWGCKPLPLLRLLVNPLCAMPVSVADVAAK
jgi:hypothetical protein